MKILGIDTGYSRIGYCIVDKSIVTYGLYPVEKIKEYENKVLRVYEYTEELIKNFNVNKVVLESVYFNRNIKTYFKVVMMMGVIYYASLKNNCEVEFIEGNKVKKIITGSGKAKKKDVMEVIKKIIGDIKMVDDVYDAIAISIASIGGLGNVNTSSN